MLEILGYTHLVGTSRKTGRQYDFYQCHCFSDNLSDRHVGKAVEIVNVSTDDFENFGLTIGSKFELTRHGRVVNI